MDDRTQRLLRGRAFEEPIDRSGSTQAACAPREQSVALTLHQTATPGCRGVLTVPARNCHWRKAAWWRRTRTFAALRLAGRSAVPRVIATVGAYCLFFFIAG